MGKKSKNNEVYKIEIEIDNLTKEQYESIWAQLVDISGHSGKEITMKGRLEEPSDESSGLHKHVVIKSLPDIDIDKAEELAMITDYAVFSDGDDINTADAGAFFLEGYIYAQRQLGNVL